MKVTFTVPGRPVPKQRPRVGKNGNIYTPGRCRCYERQVGIYAKQAFRQPFTGPVELEVTCYFTSRPGDLDNYVKAISDGLNGVAWLDDRQVVSLRASIRVAAKIQERAEVAVRKVQGKEV